jgi:hypothetical protein
MKNKGDLVGGGLGIDWAAEVAYPMVCSSPPFPGVYSEWLKNLN